MNLILILKILLLSVFIFTGFISPNDNLKDIIAQNIKEGDWHLLKPYFNSSLDFEKFIANFVFDSNHPYVKKLEKEGNKSLLAKLKPLEFKGYKNDTIYLNEVSTKTQIMLFVIINNSTNKVMSYQIYKQ